MRIRRWAAAAACTAALGGLAVPAAAAPGGPAAAGETVNTTVRQAIAALPVADESRAGYERSKFKHWVDSDRDGCNTRNEVLLDEAVIAPTRGARCSLSGGVWHSYYDDVDVDGPRGLDIDHMVPLAEAWDSGASGWTVKEREAYANDLGDSRSLVAVTARSNRSKADQDPSQWLPPAEDAHCRYLAEWTTVKTRWGLSVDAAERTALWQMATECPDQQITVDQAR